ncbi:hypothetical protein DE146DRAFT_639321 [Phaeosphaeria sp. MPI-PUGE-AT-0046c]|nr:hypothetical protein DE146DRAFT_639321 [Phaeosphaeria sp. MPI-PUGE-AT-0046c]
MQSWGRSACVWSLVQRLLLADCGYCERVMGMANAACITDDICYLLVMPQWRCASHHLHQRLSRPCLKSTAVRPETSS